MTTTHFTFLALCFLGFVANGGRLPAQTPERLALVGATVIDSTGAPPIPDAVILIENHRIRAVGARSELEVPKGFERRDLAGLTVLPGLIDSHVHLNFALPRGPNDPDADAVINSALTISSVTVSPVSATLVLVTPGLSNSLAQSMGATVRARESSLLVPFSRL